MDITLENPDTVAALKREAEKLRCSPQRLAELIVDICLDEALVDAVLDGERPVQEEVSQRDAS